MDGVDADDLKEGRGVFMHEIRFVHDHSGIIRAVVDLSILIVIRLRAVRNDLIRVLISDDTAVLHASGIGAGASLGLMARTGTTAQAVHTVCTAGARRHTERIGTTAR